MLEMRELKTKVGVIFCNLYNQINGKCVDMIVSATNFAMSNSNSKYPQISSYGISQDLAKLFRTIQVFCLYAYGLSHTGVRILVSPTMSVKLANHKGVTRRSFQLMIEWLTSIV